MVEAVSEEKARQIEVDYHRTAWLAMHIMNTQGRTLKRPVTVERLLGKGKAAALMRTNEEREKTINVLLKKFEDSKK